MWAPPEVLILEDDREQLRGLELAVRSARLEPVSAPAPRQALNLLQHRRPILAVLDLDMSLAPAADRTVAVHDVLRRLHRDHVNCIPLVFSARVETIDDQARVYIAHPHALFQSKRHGEAGLLERINGLLGARFGDLAIRGGVVIHLPSGETISHRVAVLLVAAQRAHRSLYLGDSEARAARRFQGWLERLGSPVRLRPIGGRHYRLGLRPDPPPAAE